MEVDVRFDASAGLWWKYTNPGFSGLTVDWDGINHPRSRMASPLEYLERLTLQNAAFNDRIELCGLWFDKSGGGWRIVTTQPDAEGAAATTDEILCGMEKLGYELLPFADIGRAGSLAFFKGGIAIWDAHPANVVMTASGKLLPIDVIVTPAPPAVP